MDTGVFNKPFTTTAQQIEILRHRGMLIEDENFAKTCLQNIGYYRLSGYWFKFQRKWTSCDKNLPMEVANQFSSSVSFQNIIDIYRFDSKVRSLFLDALEKIEISITSHLCDYMCNNTENTWYKKSIYFECDDEKFASLQKEIDVLIDKNKNTPSLTSFFTKYSDEYPPFWIISPYLTFGVISKLYASLKTEYKKRIADKFAINEYFMTSSLRNLANIRNICAHYGRLWDKPIKVKSINVKFATKLSKFNQKFVKNETGDYLLFAAFYMISLYLCIIAPGSKFCSLLDEVISIYQIKTPLINLQKMGFPSDWKELPLFIKMLRNKTTLQSLKETLPTYKSDDL